MIICKFYNLLKRNNKDNKVLQMLLNYKDLLVHILLQLLDKIK
jgi:hypothetical protein